MECLFAEIYLVKTVVRKIKNDSKIILLQKLLLIKDSKTNQSVEKRFDFWYNTDKK